MMNNVNIYISLIIFNFLVFGTNLKSCSNKNLEKDIEFVGTWYFCQDNRYGVEMSRNVCPEVIFQSNREGVYKGSSSDIFFTWSTSKNDIHFKFKNSSDAKLFFTHIEVLNYQFTRDKKKIRLKLYDSKSDIWYLLLRSQNKKTD